MNYLYQYPWLDYEEVTSTNDAVKELLQNCHCPCIVTAHRQTAGRGRRGRQWISETGNLFMSLAFEAKLQDLGQLVIISGLAVRNTIYRFCPSAMIQVKWPNDVLINNAKISGILFENADPDWWVMGIGINILNEPQKNMLYPTTCLARLGCSAKRDEILQVLISEFNDLYHQWQTEGFLPIKQSWLDNAYKRGKKIIIKQERFEKEGIFKEIDNNGNLILETKNGLQKIVVGDVFAVKENND